MSVINAAFSRSQLSSRRRVLRLVVETSRGRGVVDVHTIRVVSAPGGGLGGAISREGLYGLVSRGESGGMLLFGLQRLGSSVWGDACCLAERGS